MNSNKDGHGGFVFFGDATRGHVLSHTFQIRDSKARGFYRLFSITVIMKDKLLLLNIQPFLSDNIQVSVIIIQKINNNRKYFFLEYIPRTTKLCIAYKFK